MNERIEALQIQAAGIVNRTYVPQPGDYEEYEWQQRFTEEFAKLLIYDCMSLMTDRHMEDELLARFGIVDKSRW